MGDSAEELSLRLKLLQRLQRGSPGRVPRCAFPRGAGRARRAMLHAGRVERRAPATVVILRQLEVEALAVHSDGNVADAGPGVEPRAHRPERAVVRGHRARGESDCRPEELAALVEHGYSIT